MSPLLSHYWNISILRPCRRREIPLTCWAIIKLHCMGSVMVCPQKIHDEGKLWGPGGCFNIKVPSYHYRKSHCGDKTILRPSYLHNGISFTGKMTCLYWIGAHGPCAKCDIHCIRNSNLTRSRLFITYFAVSQSFGNFVQIPPCSVLNDWSTENGVIYIWVWDVFRADIPCYTRSRNVCEEQETTDYNQP